MIEIAAVLTPAETSEFRERLMQVAWNDGAASAGHVAARAKNNLQLNPADTLHNVEPVTRGVRLTGLNHYLLRDWADS